MRKIQEKPNKKLEGSYEEVFRFMQTNLLLLSENSSLAQPLPNETYPTVVTYGAYEEPILGDGEESNNAKLE